MAYTQKDGQGSLFKNDRKDKENHPDYKGSIRIDGQDFWLSAWIKKGDKGTFMSIAAQPKEDGRKQEKAPEKARNGGRDFADDDVPFRQRHWKEG